MIVEILLLIVGLVLIIAGAEFLVDGSSSIARRFGVSEFVIGLTIVGMGTSAPEMVVSFMGAFQGKADIALGNVIGSNIFNTLLILGVTCFLMPMAITKQNMKRDIPMNIGITLLLILLGMHKTFFGIGNDVISRWDGILFILIFAAYMYWSFKHDKSDEPVEEVTEKQPKLLVAILLVVTGLFALIFGGKVFVNAATEIAKMVGLSDKFIAVTILAGGTSLPELATCIVAAAKKKGQLALGNILGSNIFNILLILGGSALIHPLHFGGVNLVDLGVLLLSALLIWASAHMGKKAQIDRFDGFVMLACEIGYMVWLFINL